MGIAIENQFGCVELSSGGSVKKVCCFLGASSCEVPIGEDFFDNLPNLPKRCCLANIEDCGMGGTGETAPVAVILDVVRGSRAAINDTFKAGKSS